MVKAKQKTILTNLYTKCKEIKELKELSDKEKSMIAYANDSYLLQTVFNELSTNLQKIILKTYPFLDEELSENLSLCYQELGFPQKIDTVNYTKFNNEVNSFYTNLNFIETTRRLDVDGWLKSNEYYMGVISDAYAVRNIFAKLSTEGQDLLGRYGLYAVQSIYDEEEFAQIHQIYMKRRKRKSKSK